MYTIDDQWEDYEVTYRATELTLKQLTKQAIRSNTPYPIRSDITKMVGDYYNSEHTDVWDEFYE